jgi:cell division protein FtsN
MSGNKGKVIAGMFIGMVLGVAAAAGVAWYLVEKKPAFTNKEPSKPAQQVAPLVASAPVAATPPVVAASGVTEPKQHFEFYKVLTDKDNAQHKNTAKPKEPVKEPMVAKPHPVAPPPVAAKDMYYVQAGSFQNVGDAEKLKAKLAFSGFEANIQTANIPDKGEWHRVRLGPFSSSEAGKTISALKQNGIIATQVHAQ